MATVPTPPEPAWMRTFCPVFRCALSTSTCQAVKPTRGMEAASSMVRFFGFFATASSCIAMHSANPHAILASITIDDECLHHSFFLLSFLEALPLMGLALRLSRADASSDAAVCCGCVCG